MWHDSNIVVKEMRTNVPLQRVWDAWTECDKIEGWFADKVTGWPGAGGTLEMHWEKFGITVEFVLAEMDLRKRVVYKTRTPGMGTQVITVKLGRRAPETVLTLSESGPENHKCDLVESGVESGWQMALGILKLYLENHYGKKRKSFMGMLPATFEYDQLRPFYTTEQGLAYWWTEGGVFPHTLGERFELTLHGGEKMTGQVLAVTHHEVALSWDQINGYVEFKSFPLQGGQKSLCLRGAGYEVSQEVVDQAEFRCKDSLVRLFAALAGAGVG